MKAKRFISFMICILLILSTFAFSLAEASDIAQWGEQVKANSGGKTIVVAMASHPSTDAFRTMVGEFTELTGIEVIWDIVEETNLKNKQLLDVQGSGSYDVMMVDAFWMSEYASKNVLLPIKDFAEREDTPEWFVYEDIMPAYRNGIAGAEGVNYGIPTAGETRFIAYRTDLFEKYGKEPPKNMAEFLELAQFFNGKEDGLYGVSMRAQRGIHFASGWMSLMYNFGGGFLDQSTIGSDNVVVTCNTPETKESLQFFVDLLKCAPPDVGTYTHEEALGAFVSGKTAMWLDATALANQITNKETSTVADKVAFVPTPTGPAGDGAALAGWNLAISSKSKNPDEAWAFICFMASKEKSVDYIKAGGVGTRASVFQNDELASLNPSYEAQKAALEVANGLVEKGLSWIPQHDQINQILEIAGAYGSDALAGNISVEDACNKMQLDVEDLIK
ncbi:MAG: sugar ABC transporter substrate-binding protein [Christensenellaceae bacterium]|nr:sugar ABC transporter substrate-binding protein [Christensenellaceae bacterium]